MSVGNRTTRDQLERLMAVGARATRYWWLVMLVLLVGGGLSAAFAFTAKPVYESETVLLYREAISAELIQGRQVAQNTRNLSSRYKEILYARKNLREVCEKFDLADGDDEEAMEAAVEDLRLKIAFRNKGAGTFVIAYRDSDPQVAKDVTQYLADVLKREDQRLLREDASREKSFLEEEKKAEEDKLRAAEKRISTFLAAHPEFADEAQGGAAGAAVRAAEKKRNVAKGDETDARLLALLRQRNRIEARLEAPNEPVRAAPPRAKSPERIAAEAEVARRERAVDAARRDLESKGERLTERHPDVIKARSELDLALRELRRAEAAVPPDEGADPVVVGPIDRDALRRELTKVEREIAARRAQLREDGGDDEVEPVAEEDNWVVALETDWASLNRAVEEARQRVDALDARLFTASMKASSQMAAEGSNLSVIDPANKPLHPIGKGKKIIVLAGVFVFGLLGTAIALGLALIDDRIYTRYDLEQLGIAPVLVAVPRSKKRRKRKRRG